MVPKRPQCSSGLPHSRGSEFARAILVRACSAAVARLHSLGRRDSARRALRWRRSPARARRARRTIKAVGQAIAVRDVAVRAWLARRGQLERRADRAEAATSTRQAAGGAGAVLVRSRPAELALGVARAKGKRAGTARHGSHAAGGASVALIAWRALRGDGEICLVGVGTRVARQRRRRARLTIVARVTVTAVCCARFALVGPARARRALGEAACDGESSLGARRLLRRAGGGVVARRSVGAFARSGEVRGVREGARLARQGRRSALGAEVARRAGAAARSARVVLEQSSGTFAAAQQV